MLQKRAVGGAQRLHAGLGKRVDHGWHLMGLEPARQGAFRKVAVERRRGLRADGCHARFEPHFAAERVEMGERQASETDPDTRVGQDDGQGQRGVHVEAAARPGEQHVPGIAKALEEKRLEHDGMIAASRGRRQRILFADSASRQRALVVRYTEPLSHPLGRR